MAYSGGVYILMKHEVCIALSSDAESTVVDSGTLVLAFTTLYFASQQCSLCKAEEYHLALDMHLGKEIYYVLCEVNNTGFRSKVMFNVNMVKL